MCYHVPPECFSTNVKFDPFENTDVGQRRKAKLDNSQLFLINI